VGCGRASPKDAVRSSKAESVFEEAEKAVLKWVIEPFL
jgi:hypothetical protein